MTAAASLLFAFAALAAGAVMGVVLRRAWRSADARRPVSIVLGWAIAVAGVATCILTMGAAPGVFLASALISAGALAWVVSGLTLREAKSRGPRETALEPSGRASRAWRGWLRALLAGPLGGLAAVGVGVAVTVWAPGAPQTRIVLGGLLVPLLWGAAMAWTLSDDRILRATVVLAGVAVVTFGASALRGFA